MGLADLNPAKRRMASEGAVVVKIASISRPVDITHRARLSNRVRPPLGLEVKEQQFRRIQVKRRQIPAIYAGGLVFGC